MKELWKAITGYEEYQVSSLGRVKRDGKFLRPCLVANGYLVVNLSDGKEKTHYIHRLVAESFLENPNSLPQVNHKNGDKTNNKIENLEWCDKSQNAIHSLYVLGNSHGCVKTRKVKCLETGIVYDSVKSAAEANGVSHNCISAVALNRPGYKSTKGLHWKFV